MRERVLLALMCAVFLRIPVEAAGQSPQTSTAVVISNAAIYASPDAALPPLRVAAQGTVLGLVATEGDWAQVEYSDPQFGHRVGWMQRASLNAAASLQPMDLSVKSDTPSQVATPAPVAPKSEPAPPCVIVKIYQKKAADAFIRWTVPKPYNFVEGDFPRGFRFRSELNDAHIREVQGLGGRVVVMRPDYVLEDLEDARRSCRATSR